MDEKSNPHIHAVKALYEKAMLIASCDEYPHFMLVVFPAEHEDRMWRAIGLVNQHYHLGITENHITRGDGFAGFYLPRDIAIKIPGQPNQMARSLESIVLEDWASKGMVMAAPHTKTMDEMFTNLPEALQRAYVSKHGFDLN